EANLKLQELTEVLQRRSAELEQSEKSWKSLVENTPDIVARIDENGRIIYVNQSLTLFGLDPSSVVGENVWDLEKHSTTKDNGVKHLNLQILQAIKSGKTINFYQDFSIG